MKTELELALRKKEINSKPVRKNERQTDAEAEPVTVLIVRAVVIGCGEVDELRRFDLLVEVVSERFSAVDLNLLVHFAKRERRVRV